MAYEIKIQNKKDFSAAKSARIVQNPWGSTYTPEVTFRMVFVENEGFYALLSCAEKDPLVRYHAPFDPVWNDSCLELFMNFAPETDDRYINFEMNAGGAYIFSIGKDRHGRLPIREAVNPSNRVTVENDRWQTELFVPLETIRALYGKSDFKGGTKLLGNAYKCGDETASPHFLALYPIKTDEPDFHRPEFFGEFVLV